MSVYRDLGVSADTRAYLDTARARRARVVVSAITLTEVLRGAPRDAAAHHVLPRITVAPVTAEIARRAGELLGKTGLSGHRSAIDAVVAATALELRTPGGVADQRSGRSGQAR